MLSVATSRPHPARIYDYGLGGKNRFAVDREVAEKASAGFALGAGTRPRPGYQACPGAAMAAATSAGVVTQMPSMAVMARSASFT